MYISFNLLSFQEELLVDEGRPFILEEDVFVLVEGVDGDFLLLNLHLAVRFLDVVLDVLRFLIVPRVELVLQEFQVCLEVPLSVLAQGL